jgi:CubicO group peptidase (beta-lactamase class C family)
MPLASSSPALSLFQAASISKPVTTLAVLHLAHEGKLSLDTDVNHYLTSWKLPPVSSQSSRT